MDKYLLFIIRNFTLKPYLVGFFMTLFGQVVKYLSQTDLLLNEISMYGAFTVSLAFLISTISGTLVLGSLFLVLYLLGKLLQKK